ncbi:MAG: AI-2E family transporter [Phormidesmis sp.]
MSFRKLPRWVLWSLFLPLMVLNGWVALKLFEYFQSLFTIVISSTLLAFILNYPVQRLQRLPRLSRGGAIAVVLLLGSAMVGIAGVTLFPQLFSQLAQFAETLPEWIASSGDNISGIQSWVTKRGLNVDIASLVTQLETYLSAQAKVLSGLVITALPDAIANLLDIFLTIVLTIYLLLHGGEVWGNLLQLLPVKIGRRLTPAVSMSFHNYFISQATVSLMMGVAMTVAFLVIRAPFGLLFGIVIGVLGMIPFGASLGIIAVSVLAAFQSVWLGLKVLVVAFVVDQIVENAIAPTLIGNVIGLNPVWILVSLIIGSKILGLLGLIIAVPIASTIKVLLSKPADKPRPIAPAEVSHSVPLLKG